MKVTLQIKQIIFADLRNTGNAVNLSPPPLPLLPFSSPLSIRHSVVTKRALCRINFADILRRYTRNPMRCRACEQNLVTDYRYDIRDIDARREGEERGREREE